MKRFGCLALLMLVSSSAHASSFSFGVGGFRIHFNTPHHCTLRSCASVSIGAINQTRRHREPAQIGPLAPVQEVAKPPLTSPQLASVPPVTVPVQPTVEVPPPVQPSTETVPAATTKQADIPTPSSPPPPATTPATTETAPPPVTSAVPPQPMQTADVTPPAVPVEPKLAKAPPESPAKQADTPLGDWRTEGGKGLVRIETCGSALCGYVLDPSSHAIGESVLVNMKPNGTALWSGNVYSRATGTTYYGTMRMKGADSLRVEACALGRFFCSGNVWSRVGRPHEYISSSQAVPEPRS